MIWFYLKLPDQDILIHLLNLAEIFESMVKKLQVFSKNCFPYMFWYYILIISDNQTKTRRRQFFDKEHAIL